MTSDKGNKLAQAIPDDALTDNLHPILSSTAAFRSASATSCAPCTTNLMEQPVPDRFKDLLASWKRRTRRRREMTPEPALRDALLAAVPVCAPLPSRSAGQVDRADDLVQDTLLRALSNIHRFEPGTNLNAWLFTILRNLFHSEYRKRRREVEDPDGSYAGAAEGAAGAGLASGFRGFPQSPSSKLPSDQSEALLLVGASGFSYEEAATSAAARSAPSRAG